mgnify:CR=1 FL=1
MVKKYAEQQKNVRNNREFNSISKETEYQELEIELAEKRIKEFKAKIEQKNEAKLRESALAFWQKMEAGDYLNNVEKSLNEQVVLAGENDVKKPDKVLVKANEVLVIDFKTGKINQNHMEQVVAYGKLLEVIFKKPVRCLLYYSALNQLTEL